MEMSRCFPLVKNACASLAVHSRREVKNAPECSIPARVSWVESRFPNQFSQKALNCLIFRSCRISFWHHWRPDAQNCSPKVMPSRIRRGRTFRLDTGSVRHGCAPRGRESHPPRKHLLLAPQGFRPLSLNASPAAGFHSAFIVPTIKRFRSLAASSTRGWPN